MPNPHVKSIIIPPEQSQKLDILAAYSDNNRSEEVCDLIESKFKELGLDIPNKKTIGRKKASKEA